MTTLVLRSGWRASPSGPISKPLRQVKGLAVHHSGERQDERHDHLQCHQVVRGIQAAHVGVRGWADIGYSWLVCRHNVLFEGRGWTVRPASQGTDYGNDHFLSVCVLGHGGMGFLARSSGALVAVQYLRRGLLDRSPSATSLLPHSAFHPTECPGDEIRKWISDNV